jgi:hypothetical protein
VVQVRSVQVQVEVQLQRGLVLLIAPLLVQRGPERRLALSALEQLLLEAVVQGWRKGQ